MSTWPYTRHMIKSNPLKKDYFWNSLGVFMQNLISPLLLIVVTRINGVLDAGLFSFAFSLALIFWAFSVWGARTYQVSDTKKEFSARSYVLVRVMLSIAVFIAAWIFCLINNYDLTKAGIILLLVGYKTIESIADAVYGVLQVHGKLYISGRSLFYKSLLGAGLFIAVDYYTHNLLLSSLTLIVSNLVILCLYDLPRAQKFDAIFPVPSDLKRYSSEAITIIKRCAPIASVIFMSMFSLLIPRYYIDAYHAEENGYFGILAMPITALALFITFIMQPNIVTLSNLFFKQKYEEYKKTVRTIVGVILAISLVSLPIVYFFGADILKIIFGINFSHYQGALIIFVIGAIVNGFVTVFINLLTIMRHFKIQFYTLLFTNILLAIVSLLIIPKYSLMGGVMLYLSTNAIQLAFLIIAYYKAIRDESKSHQIR